MQRYARALLFVDIVGVWFGAGAGWGRGRAVGGSCAFECPSSPPPPTRTTEYVQHVRDSNLTHVQRVQYDAQSTHKTLAVVIAVAISYDIVCSSIYDTGTTAVDRRHKEGVTNRAGTVRNLPSVPSN